MYLVAMGTAGDIEIIDRIAKDAAGKELFDLFTKHWRLPSLAVQMLDVKIFASFGSIFHAIFRISQAYLFFIKSNYNLQKFKTDHYRSDFTQETETIHSK